MKRCSAKILKPKTSPSALPVPGHTKTYSAHKDIYQSSPQKSARISAKEQSWDGLLLHCLADVPYSIISNPGKMPPGLGTALCVKREEAERSAEEKQVNCEVSSREGEQPTEYTGVSSNLSFLLSSRTPSEPQTCLAPRLEALELRPTLDVPPPPAPSGSNSESSSTIPANTFGLWIAPEVAS